MKEIRSTIEIVTDAQYPLVSSIILFKDITQVFDVDGAYANFAFNSYKVIPPVTEVGTEGEEGYVAAVPEEYEMIRVHSKQMQGPEMDTVFASLTIGATTYTARSQEEIVKGAMKVIDTLGSFGLTEADLVAI
jgi:hypothetical protein